MFCVEFLMTSSPIDLILFSMAPMSIKGLPFLKSTICSYSERLLFSTISTTGQVSSIATPELYPSQGNSYQISPYLSETDTVLRFVDDHLLGCLDHEESRQQGEFDVCDVTDIQQVELSDRVTCHSGEVPQDDPV